MFTVILILLVAAITFFHYLQGFFAATLSACIAVLAALVAVSYHEPLVVQLAGGQYIDSAPGMVLIGLFALTYLVLRLLIDRLVPGNVRFAPLVDKIGGAAMGLVAALFATGICTVAVQMMPLGPSLLGYSRYKLGPERSVIVTPPRGQQRDMKIYGEMAGATLASTPTSGVFPPVDSLVLSLAAHVSDGGSMAGDQPLKAIHPDLLTQLFANRVAIQPGAKRTAMNLANRTDVTVKAASLLGKTIPKRVDPITLDLRDGKKPLELADDAATKRLVVVRTTMGKDSGELENFILHINTGSVRLVLNRKNHFPVGMMTPAGDLAVVRIDDPLFFDLSKADTAIDWVFAVAESDLKPMGAESALPAGAFIEVKRLARVDLSSRKLTAGAPAGAVLALMRPGVQPQQQQPDTPAPKAAQVPMVFTVAATSNRFFARINVGTGEPNSPFTVGFAEGAVRDGKLSTLTLETGDSLEKLGEGEFTVQEFFVPRGRKMVQIMGTPPPTAEGAEAWRWASEVRKFQLVDSQNGRHAPAGAWARVRASQGDSAMARYNADDAIGDIRGQTGRPIQITLAFLIDEAADPRELKFDAETFVTLEQDPSGDPGLFTPRQ